MIFAEKLNDGFTNFIAGNHDHLWDQDGPLLVRRGGVALHKEQRTARQHGMDHTGNLTQVRATVRRKTLLLLWWSDSGKVVVERSTLA